MALNNISELSTTAASNSDLAGTSILGTGLVSTADDSFRNMASFLKKWWNDLGAINTVAGTGDAITVTTVTVYGSLINGMFFRFVAGAANTTATTLNLDAIGAKAVRKISGGTDVALAAGDLAAGETYTVIYRASANSAAGAWVLVGLSAGTTFATRTEANTGTSTTKAVPPAYLYFPTGHLWGLTLTNSGADSIVIAVGTARDATDTINIVQSSSLTKSVATSWAVGSAQGGLDTGSVGNSKYYIWKIIRSDTGVTDALFSLSNSAPTMPTNYDYKVLIGEFVRASATNGAPIWYGGSRPGNGIYQGLHLLAQGDVAAAATLDIVLTSYTQYRGLVFELVNFIPATDNDTFAARVSTNGGSSYDASASDYKTAGRYDLSGGTGGTDSSAGQAQAFICNGVGNGAAEGVSATVALLGQTNTAVKPKLQSIASIYVNDDQVKNGSVTNIRNTAQDTDAIRFLFLSGNIASGSYAVYGYV